MKATGSTPGNNYLLVISVTTCETRVELTGSELCINARLTGITADQIREVADQFGIGLDATELPELTVLFNYSLESSDLERLTPFIYRLHHIPGPTQ